MTNLVKCINCKNFNFRSQGGAGMARQGLGVCALKPAYTYFGATKERECKKILTASDEVIAARVEFLNRQEQKHGNN